ncbi:MAG: hypothetical protein FJX20_22865 [Alphaproteobacteria bacterium]|nr:hypothetical protein [Alphaproteobacteria bacterium]
MSDDDVLRPSTWSRPKPERHGDIDVDDIYIAVGRALSEWSMVEIALGRLYATLDGAPPQTAWSVYAAERDPRARIARLSEAADTRFSDGETEDGTTCRRVIEAAGLAAQRRDDIVHGIVVLFRPGALDGSYLVPTGFTAGDSNVPEYAYTAAQITTLRGRLGRLQDEINVLILRLQEAGGA